MPQQTCCSLPLPLSHHHHPRTNTLSPLPARPLPQNHIFALAALPEDHPHALRFPERRAPKLVKTKSVIRSPSFGLKLRGQLGLRRWGTVGSLRAEVYDGDEQRVTSEDVMRRMVAEAEGRGGVLKGEDLKVGKLSPLSSSPDLRRLAALSSPAPVARRVHSTLALSATGREREVSEVSDVELRDLACLNLDLEKHQVDGGLDCEGDGIEGSEGFDRVEGEEGGRDRSGGAGEREGLIVVGGLGEGAEQAAGADCDAAVEVSTDIDNDNDIENERSHSPASFHLTKKHISQLLRSKSQLSSPSEDTDRLTPEAWSFHCRERSNCGTSTPHGASTRSRHVHNTSESGVDSANVPASWGRVTVCCDSSSSIYSRPTSPEWLEPYEIPADLGAVADWPLTGEVLPSTLDHVQAGYSETVDFPEDSHITIVEPALPTEEAKETAYAASEQEENGRSTTPQREPSHKSNSSSATRSTRFLERFTPPKRFVRKRRSIFKFLRAGSRRQQTRSVSTPVLCSPSLRPCVDGPSLPTSSYCTVRSSLSSEGNPTRSVSLNNLPAPSTSDDAQDTASSPDLRRKPSLAEYERHLSVVRDNRRRPSARELKRLSQIEEDDQQEPTQTKNTFSLYSETQETDPLMAAALRRQMQEKALFRSTSKRSVPISEGSSLSFLATSWDEPSHTEPQSPERDPLDSSARKPGDYHLSPPRTPVGSYSRTSSLSNQKQTSGKKPIILHTPSSISRTSITSRIGTSLDSWARFPSHSRGERCASAGAADNIRTRDFALHDTEQETDPFDPSKRVFTKHSTKSSKKSLPKSRSATFGSFVRYYSNLFNSSPDFHGKGRRTSVVAGGTLRHPELEILPPVMPVSGKASHHSAGLGSSEEREMLRAGDLERVDERAEEGAGKSGGSLLREKNLGVLGVPATGAVAFRGNSVFTSPSHAPHQGVTSEEPGDSTVATTDLSDPLPTDSHHPPNLDGTTETTTDPIKRPSHTSSKAQAWSEIYQNCLVIPPSPSEHDHEREHQSPNPTKPPTVAPASTMPPPLLKPTKRTSPTQPTTLDPKASIRRFPSVTVVDDRKGHWRSVSFISVKSSKSGASMGGFVRESSNDLLRLMEEREKEERERLLRGIF